MIAAVRPKRICRAMSRRAFTMVELLMTLGILVILAGLMLPAVQVARESARQTHCRNNLRQLGIAALTHENAWGHLPSNGFGLQWVGDSNRGFGANQPGGWIFNILPYSGSAHIRDLPPSGGILLQTPFALLNCPTRRPAIGHAWESSTPICNGDAPAAAAKSDYAVNGGDKSLPSVYYGPPCGIAATGNFNWPDMSSQTGVGFVRSQVRMSHISDGTSATILIGEKYVRIGKALGIQNPDAGDDQGAYVGDCADIRRWTTSPPRRDREGFNDPLLFGSRHIATCNFVFCDGATRSISYLVDWKVFRNLGNRYDGNSAGDF